jgi:hypothetical protein
MGTKTNAHHIDCLFNVLFGSIIMKKNIVKKWVSVVGNDTFGSTMEQ